MAALIIKAADVIKIIVIIFNGLGRPEEPRKNRKINVMQIFI